MLVSKYMYNLTRYMCNLSLMTLCFLQ